MVTCFFIVSEFQPVEGRSAGQRLALVLGSTSSGQRILFTNHHGKERIESQKIMIIEILVASRQSQQTLSNEFAHGVFDQEWVAQIAKAPGQRAGNPQTLIDLTQQEHAAIAAEVSCGEVCEDLARAQGIKRIFFSDLTREPHQYLIRS